VEVIFKANQFLKTGNRLFCPGKQYQRAASSKSVEVCKYTNKIIQIINDDKTGYNTNNDPDALLLYKNKHHNKLGYGKTKADHPDDFI
jgi:hypothetical protein